MNSDLMFSSSTGEWETPQYFYDMLDREFRFKLDPCATDDNAKCEHYFTKTENGLFQSWVEYERIFMNPPYGRETGKWVQKAFREWQKGALVVGLLPARTDTKWFHEFIYMPEVEIRFIKGRLKFGKSKNSAPFPSMVVIWRREIY